MDQMDVQASAEATAPLPIRQPTGSNVGQFKQQAYPVISKRPEHLRMNLWPLVQLRVFLCFLYFFYMDTWGEERSPPSLPSAIYCPSHLMSMCLSLSLRNCYSSSHPKNKELILRWFLPLHIKWIIRIGPSFGLSTFLHDFTIKGTKKKKTITKKKTLFANVQISRWSYQDDQVMLRNCFQWDALSFYSISEESWIAFQLLTNCTNHCGLQNEMHLWEFHPVEVCNLTLKSYTFLNECIPQCCIDDG